MEYENTYVRITQKDSSGNAVQAALMSVRICEWRLLKRKQCVYFGFPTETPNNESESDDGVCHSGLVDFFGLQGL
jgi:hypothetical protein